MASPVVIPGQYGPTAGTITANSFSVYGGPASGFIGVAPPDPPLTQIIAPPPAVTTTAVPLTDAGVAADTLAVSAVTAVALTETGTGTDALVAVIATAVPLTGTGVAADTLAAAITTSVPFTDAGVAADALAVTAVVPFTGTGTGADTLAATVVILVALADTGHGADTVPFHTGAFVNNASYPGPPAQAAANTLWESNSGRTLSCRRTYYGAGTIPGAIDANLTLDVTAGRRAVINIRPTWNGISSGSPLFGTDQTTAVDTFLASCQAAGLDAVVSVWGEPFGKGVASADFIPFFQHFYPVIHAYYPVAFLTSASSVFNNAEYSWYPGDAYCDIVATDLYYGTWARGGGNGTIVSGYASAFGSTSDLAHDPAYQADHAVPPKPFGIYETTTSTDTTSGVSQANATAFWHYIRDAMADRVARGLPGGDVLVFNSQSAPLSNETAIVVADGVTDPYGGFGGVTTEYRNALFASLYDTLTPLLADPAVTSTVPFTDAGVAADSLAVTSTAALTDTGHAADTLAVAGTFTVPLTETGTGADVLAVTSVVPLTDAGVGTDTLAAAIATAVPLTDAGTGTDALAVAAATVVPLTDAGVAADALAVVIATAIPVTDAGTGTDALAVAAAVAPTEAGTGADTLTVSAGVPLAEAGVAADSVTAASAVPLADAGTAADTLATAVATLVPLTDAGTGTTALAVTTVTPVPLAEAGTGTDSLAVVTITPVAFTDAGHGTDATGTVLAAVSLAELGAAADAFAYTFITAPFTIGALTTYAAPGATLTASAAPAGGSGYVLTATDTRTGGPG